MFENDSSNVFLDAEYFFEIKFYPIYLQQNITYISLLINKLSVTLIIPYEKTIPSMFARNLAYIYLLGSDKN